MKINGVELEDLEIYDADVAEKYENALEEVDKKAKEAEKETKASAAIRKQCQAVFDFFNTMFGEGTDEKIFGNKTNLIVCLDALEEFKSRIDEREDELQKKYNKYSPNRAERRKK